VKTGPIQDLLSRDHDRLEELLEAVSGDQRIDHERFHEFRAGLLRHIGMEEKILLPAAKRLRGGEALPAARQLRLDHAALAALLVPTPTPVIIGRLRALLHVHNGLEEGDEGVYARCEHLVGEEGDALLREMRSARPVKLAPYQDGPRALASIDRLLRAAGRV
jgi:hypothetical protein